MEWNVKKHESIGKSCRKKRKKKVEKQKKKKLKQVTKMRGKKNSPQLCRLIWCSKFWPTHDKIRGREVPN